MNLPDSPSLVFETFSDGSHNVEQKMLFFSFNDFVLLAESPDWDLAHPVHHPRDRQAQGGPPVPPQLLQIWGRQG